MADGGSSGGTPGGKRRAPLPDNVDFKASPKATKSRDYNSGVRNHVTPSKQPERCGYKVYIKAKAHSYQEGLDMADKISGDLTIQAEHGYYDEKAAADGNQAKEAALFFQFFTSKGLADIKTSAETHLGTKLADTAGDWHVRPLTFNLQIQSDTVKITGASYSFFIPQLLSLASTAELATDSDDKTFLHL